MDNLGRSLNRTLIGDSQVVKGNNEEGNLSVEGDLLVQGDVAFDNVIMNDLKVVNSLQVDGYTLPTSAGTDGQVLTMNPDGKTTDFKDITGGVARVWTNLYSMTTPNDAPSTAVLNIDSQGIGTKTISVADFSIGSSLRFIAEGQYKFRLNDANDLLKLETDFQILGDFGVHNIKLWEFVLNNPPSPAAGIGTFIENVGYFKLHFYISRIDATTLKLGSVSLQAYPIINALNDAQIIEINSPLQNPAISTPANYTILNSGNLNFNIKSYNLFSYFSGSTAALNTQIYTIDFCNSAQSVLSTSQTLSGNHLLLSNLNSTGVSGFLDAGHDLMYLSDGSKPMTGSINMNSNNIINCVSLSNDGGTELLDFSSNNALLKTDGQLAGIQETNTLNNIVVSPNISGITALLGEIQIRNISNTGTIYTYTQGGDILTETKGTTPSDIKITSNKDIYLNSKTMNITPINELKITTPITTHNGILNMFDNNIIECKEINHSFNDIRIKSNINNVIIETGLIGGSSIDNIVCNYNNTTINNNLNVGTINNLTAVGGVSASTSNSALIQNTTATISLLSASFVGSRSVPPNTFKIGDAYSAVLAGTFDATNGTDLTIILNAGAVGTNAISQIIVPLSNASASFFELEINFCIKTLGVAGEMAVNYDFSYNGGGGNAFQGERKCENVNINTTILNTLDITASFSIASVNNAIQSLYGTLTKIY